MTSPLIRPEIAALAAYHVHDASGYLKLDAMENPYRLPDALRAEMGTRLADALINRYPDPSPAGLKARIAAGFGVPAGMDLLLGNGSDEIIQMVAMTLARPGAKLLAVEPSFVMYRMIATFCGLAYVGVPLRDDFQIDLDATLAAVREHRPALTFLSYPNNPTGPRFDRATVEDVIRAASPGLVVIDEAYHAFADDSFLPRLGEFDNVVVMRTLSKLGLAGLRLGFLAGSPAWLSEFDKVRLPYNVNVLTQTAALFALEHLDVLDRQATQLRAERQRLSDALARLPALTVYPSEANFITIRVPDAPATYAALKEAGILIKNLHGAHPMLDNCLRLTVGTPQDNAAMLAVLNALFA